MAIKDSLLAEFDHEMGATRRVLERLPAADLAWKPHEKSFSLGQLASHVSNLPHWMNIIFERDVLDLAEVGDDGRPKEPSEVGPILAWFDDKVKSARATLDAQTDQTMMSRWTLKQAGQQLFIMPKVSVVRSFVMNHLIHHRGQLTVYLRLRNVPLPALYGPTADEG